MALPIGAPVAAPAGANAAGPNLPGNSPPANMAICCVICGIPILPSVDNALTRLYSAEETAWMQPLLLRPKEEYHATIREAKRNHSYQRCDDNLLEVIYPVAFLGGGDGFRVRVPVTTTTTNDDDDDDDDDDYDYDYDNDSDDGDIQQQQEEILTLSFDFSRKNADNLAIPLHTGCHTMARHFCADQSRFHIDFRTANSGVPSSIAHLWEIWQKRWLMTPIVDVADRSRGIVNRPVFEPHRYLGAVRVDNLADYAHHLISTGSDVGGGGLLVQFLGPPRDSWYERFQADPLGPARKYGRNDIGGRTTTTAATSVTAQIVFGAAGGTTLQRINPAVEYNNLEAHVEVIGLMMKAREKLPQEMMLNIEGKMEPFVNESMVCTRAYPPKWWRDKLLDGHAIPWLWDLNFEEVRAARIAQGIHPDDETRWDWERLVRQLSQTDIFGPDGDLGDASHALWNRHRIWTLLSKARLAHLQYVL